MAGRPLKPTLIGEDLGGSRPALRKCILVKRRKLHGPSWVWVNQYRVGPEIRPLILDVAAQETVPIGHLVLLGVSRSESHDVGVDPRCDRSVAKSVSRGVDGCQDNTRCGSCDAYQLVPTRNPVVVHATLQGIVRTQILDHGIRMKPQRRDKRRQALVDAYAVYCENLNVVPWIQKLVDRRSCEHRDRVSIEHHVRLARTRAAAPQEDDRQGEQPSHKLRSVIPERPPCRPCPECRLGGSSALWDTPSAGHEPL